MKQLVEVSNKVQINTGTVIRIYNVRRLDVDLSLESSDNYQNKDFYDYMLVDLNVVSEGVYALINVTMENPNRGAVFCLFENISSRYSIEANFLKKYFSDNPDVYLL